MNVKPVQTIWVLEYNSDDEGTEVLGYYAERDVANEALIEQALSLAEDFEITTTRDEIESQTEISNLDASWKMPDAWTKGMAWNEISVYSQDLLGKVEA